MTLLLVALGLILGGGVTAALLSSRAREASLVAVAGVVAGAVAGEAHALHVLLGGGREDLIVAWNVPYGQLHLGVDPLSAFFLVPTFGLAALAAIHGHEYLRPYAGTKPLGVTWLAFNLLVASMVVVVVARHALLFLVAWEVMSLSAYVLVTFEHEDEEVRRAGWVYLVATHVGTAALVAMFLLLGRSAHGFDFDAAGQAEIPRALSGLLFVLSVAGFGVKAGLIPLHVWLPEAHAAAPSPVSALMSGVLIKMGIYGVLRMVVLLGRPAPWWGSVLMALGLAGALLGISLALYQRDAKRVLAYSSIENMGLITLGLGIGLWGLTSGRPEVAVLGLTGGLLHVWNHSLMKGLMFLGVGSVVHGCHTKDLEKLGGVMKSMPRTATALLVGAVAIAGLPPMNGFVGEWLLYLGLIDGALASRGATGVAVLMSVGIVALVGGLAVLCFVRLVGIALLGQPRSEGARHAHESSLCITAPLLLLALLSVAVGLFPRAPLSAIGHVTAELLGRPTPLEAPVAGLGRLDALLWGLSVAGIIAWQAVRRGRPVATDATWGCGYASPSPRMQYTARSFAELMSDRLLPERLRAKVSVVAPSTIFPRGGGLSSDYSDPLTRGVYEPFLARWGDRFARLRWLQQGMLHVYLVYVLFAALLALAWTSMRTWSGR